MQGVDDGVSLALANADRTGQVQKAFGPHTIGSTSHIYLLVQVLDVEPSFGDKSTGTHDTSSFFIALILIIIIHPHPSPCPRVRRGAVLWGQVHGDARVGHHYLSSSFSSSR